jgi:hypothetical protein
MEKITSGQDNSQPSQVNMSVVAEAPYIECEECKGTLFEEKMMIKKISRFMTGNSQDSIVPIQVISCAKCGHINELFKPKV